MAVGVTQLNSRTAVKLFASFLFVSVHWVDYSLLYRATLTVRLLLVAGLAKEPVGMDALEHVGGNNCPLAHFGLVVSSLSEGVNCVARITLGSLQ
ncbi:MAG: hypothetical protein RMK18_05405 [Armatimonadota bacterium]|nr:hypothetical protein [Armatimonadota bacterium]MCX7777956.1 hypothetical protein [Armatimonadota bacterium]MDW8025287.1 hypothetical protein [Armatimonadota bacterium]